MLYISVGRDVPIKRFLFSESFLNGVVGRNSNIPVWKGQCLPGKGIVDF